MFTYRINLWYTKSSPKGLGSADTAWCKWMWLSPAEHCLWVVYAEESLFDSERRVMLMEQELLPIFFTVIICAVMQAQKSGEQKLPKTAKKAARIHRKTANQRKDFLHKRSTEIANQYDIVCVEDLDMKAIGNKGFGNGKATFDNGYGMFLNMLEYKLKERGKYFVKVDKWYPSSQICHCCGSVKKLDLKDRVYTCDCGYTGDRDHNAAINILTEGLRILQSL